MILIPQGVGIHGMNILINISPTPSILDLKAYDPQGYHPEVTLLKRTAFASPVNDNALKCVSIDDFQTWSARSANLSEIWRNMKVEHDVFYSSDMMVFVIDKTVMNAPTIMPDKVFVDTMIDFQQSNRLYCKPTCDNIQDDVILGWIKYVRHGTTVVIWEMQTDLALKWPLPEKPLNHYYKMVDLLEVLLAEAMRIWVNAGKRRIELIDTSTMQALENAVPFQIYTSLPKRNGFEHLYNDGIWRFEVK